MKKTTRKSGSADVLKPPILGPSTAERKEGRIEIMWDAEIDEITRNKTKINTLILVLKIFIAFRNHLLRKIAFYGFVCTSTQPPLPLRLMLPKCHAKVFLTANGSNMARPRAKGKRARPKYGGKNRVNSDHHSNVDQRFFVR